MKKIINLDPHSFNKFNSKNDKFYWPISQNEVYKIRDNLEKSFCKLLIKHQKEKNMDWIFVRVILYELLKDIILTWQCSLLQKI